MNYPRPIRLFPMSCDNGNALMLHCGPHRFPCPYI